MGYSTYADFLRELEAHRQRVSHIFAGLMNTSESEREVLLEGNLFWSRIWQEPSAPVASEHLEKNGFTDPELVLQLILDLQSDTDDLQDIAEDRLALLMPVILRLASREDQPYVVLKRCIELIDAITRRSIYLAFLNENIDALQRMVRLFAMSPYVAAQIARFPILLYDLTDWEIEQEPESKIQLSERLSEELDQFASTDLESRMDVLRTFKHSTVLKTAMLELLDLQSTMKASDQLTVVAELVLGQAVEMAAEYLVERHGCPGTAEGEEDQIRFAVIAYGKLGGFELGYGSDLDVVFIHGGAGNGSTVGAKSVHNNVFYNRLGQRVVHILTSLTRFGSLYELDLRLRPDGNSGPLVVSAAGYERYIRDSAWTWEIQALVRARFVAGSASLAEQFDDIRKTVLALPRDPELLRRDVLDMREKMRRHLDTNTQPTGGSEVLLSGFDLKQGVGAIVDIEFLVQYLVLRYGASKQALTAWTDKVRLLDTLASHGVIERSEASLLQDAYIAYRRAVHFERLGGELGSFEQLVAYREQVVPIWRRYLT